MYTNIHDPLLEYEELQIAYLRKEHAPSILQSFRRTCSFVFSYLFLSGTIFLILAVGLNYSAYSNRVYNWMNPDALLQAQREVNTLLDSATSLSVHASEAQAIEKQEDLSVITEKILATDSAVVYKRKYEAENLIANIREGELPASFELAPYENRIIIPRIGKNIPLVDVGVDPHASFDKLHEVFMEELRKGVVRYPGTAEPGAKGNVFIFGHSSNFPWVQSEYNSVFALIDQLEKGDEIVIYYFQKKYIYTVTDRSIVKPGDVKTLEARDKGKKELSLMTCWPVGTTLERIIIFAELKEDDTETDSYQ